MRIWHVQDTHNAQDNVNGGWFGDRTKGVTKNQFQVFLWKPWATNQPMECSKVTVVIKLVDTANDVGIRSAGDQIPHVIGDKGKHFSVHGWFPASITCCLSNWPWNRRKFKVTKRLRICCRHRELVWEHGVGIKGGDSYRLNESYLTYVGGVWKSE